MINSLINFGVPGINGERSAVLQPIFANRFRTVFYSFGALNQVAPYDLTRQTFSIGRPNLAFEEQKLYSYMSTVYVVNRGEWEDITIKFYDDIANTVMRRVENQVAKQMNFFDQTGSRAGENYKFEIDLDILAGGASASDSPADPNVLQKWSFSGCMITKREYGEMTYQEQKYMEISTTVRFDNCIGFDENGQRMGTFSQAPEINAQTGFFSTGIGAGGVGISIGGASVSIGGGFSAGGLSVGGQLTF